jgi:AcrR family transcriptional regulator
MASAEDEISRLPPGVALAWGLVQAPNRGPRPALSVDRIVDAAIALADEGGLGAVSMSRVADALGFATMSLYRYVRNKDDLLALMVDQAVGPPPSGLLDPPPSWQLGIERWARAMFDEYRRHIWVIEVPVTAPPVMPNQLAWLDAALLAMEGCDLGVDDLLAAVLLANGWVRSWAQVSEGLLQVADAGGAAAPPELLGTLVTPERYPRLAPVMAVGALSEVASAADLDEIFTFGIERIVDGIAALVRAGGTGPG